ncbi:uncharacterized protein LOC125025064 [Penaeus chinensis]|uniref:uncharacterized protein LOC125025064 n=1 Tax=Penaeus chinensis TaxID=139456 RepID=UPI001FB763F1|nr:uncharacterized protein LOC125025064 [Penaeus chinensis]
MLSAETSPKIYRWLNNHLLLWQMLPTDSSIQEGSNVQAITLSFVESVLLLTNGGKITMYRDDKHGQMVPTFETEVACSAVDDLSVMDINKEYVMGFICENISGGTTMMFRSVLVEQIELEKGTPEIIHDCLQEVKKGLEERKPIISEFEDILANNRLLTTDTMQTWTGPVSFLGGLTVNGTASIFHTLHITQEDAKPNEETFDEFISKALDLKDEVKALQSNMSEILYHTKDQNRTLQR